MSVTILMDLETLGEFASRVVVDFAESKGFEVEDSDCEQIAQSALDTLRFLFDRADFARGVLDDVDHLDPTNNISFEPEDGFPGFFTNLAQEPHE